jgi:protein-disulfide isomerase
MYARVSDGIRRGGMTVAAVMIAASLVGGAAARAAGSGAPAGDPKKVLANVNGKPITEADVRAAGADKFEQLDREYANNVHSIVEQSLEQMIQDRLLEAEAAARKMTKEQVLADIKPAPVTDADVDAFYEQNKAQIPPTTTKEQVAPRIREYLAQMGQAKAQEAFYASLASKYKVENLLEPMRVEVASAGFPARGPEKAPVTIVEFSDFQCPFCSRLKPTLEQVLAKYGPKVRLVFRQYPLPMHSNAHKAAEASLCADAQGKFWEMHDAMFENQQQLDTEQLKATAARLGLDASKFNSCLDSGTPSPRIDADMAAGSAVGVSGTPAMFINGRFINGAVPLEDITKVIDDELRRKGAA